MRMGKLTNRVVRGAAIAASALVFAWSTARAGEIRDVKLAAGSGVTRVEVQLEGRGDFKTISLASPHRLVIDFADSSAARGLKLPPATGVVTAVRTGQPQPGTLRIVFDLADAVTARSPWVEQVSGSSSRLVIEWPSDRGLAANAPATVPAPVAPVPAPAQATVAVVQQADSAPAPSPAIQTGSAVVPDKAPLPVSANAGQGVTGLSPEAILSGQPTPLQAPQHVASAPAQTPQAVVAQSPAPADSNAAVTATLPPARSMPEVRMRAGMRPLVVAIDAGHGGQDPGAVGPGGTYEKNVVLAIARELARLVDATPGMKAYLVRNTDVFIPLPMRAQMARKAKADIFISLHADAAENRNARGSSVYVLSLKGASSQRARWLADKENASDLIGGVRLQQVDNTLGSVLLDLAQSGNMRASEDAADQVLAGLKRVGNNHKPNIERANFAVLRTSDMPAMLVETAFISNAEEEKRLKDPAYQRKVASAVLDGVNTYFTRQPPPGTLFAARAQAEAEAQAGTGAAGAP